MDFKRFFSTAGVKGTKNYLNSQKKYEVIRTVIYFAISLSLFFAGWITTGTRNNLLTIVAVLGCLPASKSLVETVMYCRYHSLSVSDAMLIEPHTKGLSCAYDMIFTSREKTYPVMHLIVRGNTIVGYMPDMGKKLSDTECAKHLTTCLNADRYTGITIKIFGDVRKYAERAEQLKQLPADEELSAGILHTLKSITL